MAKKSKKKEVDTGPAGQLTHSPFAGLLGDAPPADPPADAPRETPRDEAAPEPRGRRFGGKVVVRRQTKGRGGKTITRVSGVAAGHHDGVADEMKKALGCGAIVEDEDVLLLGDVGDRAAAWLEAAGARRVVRGS